MGATCSYDVCSKKDQSSLEISSKPERQHAKIRTGYISSTSESSDGDNEFNMDMDDLNYNSNDLAVNGEYDYDDDDDATPQPTDFIRAVTPDEIQKAINGFINAVQSGNDTLVIQLVEDNPSLNLLQTQFIDGDNCLHVAVRYKYHNLMYYLLTNGVSPNDQNTQTGDTALHMAVKTHNIKIVSLLSQFEADAKMENNNFQTALDIATDNNDQDIIELLSPKIQGLVKKHMYSSSIALKREQLKFNMSMLANIDMPTGDRLDDHDDIMQSPDTTDINVDTILLDMLADDVLSTNEYVGKPLSNTVMNPFGDKTVNQNKTQQVLHKLNELTTETINLPILENWLEKKKSKAPYGWHKRWVIVKESYMLWCDTKKIINDTKNPKERSQWKNSINLMSIMSIEPLLKSKKENKFVINVKLRQFIWKCKNKKERDYWINGLTKHINHIKSMIAYLRKNTLQ